jgi:hypothetical protein
LELTESKEEHKEEKTGKRETETRERQKKDGNTIEQRKGELNQEEQQAQQRKTKKIKMEPCFWLKRPSAAQCGAPWPYGYAHASIQMQCRPPRRTSPRAS